MYKQSILIILPLVFCLALSIEVAADDTTATPADSLDLLSASFLAALETIGEGTVLAIPSIRNTDGRDSALGNYLEERLAALLISDDRFRVVERSGIDQVVREWELSLSGMLTEDSMYEIGNMAGADALLIGILTRVDQAVQVDLRVVDTESALALASVGGVLTEPRYLSMYLDLFNTEPVGDEAFYIGRGREFEREKAFLAAFLDLCREMERETANSAFLDPSFITYLEASADLDYTRGSRYNCSLRVRRDQFSSENLYNYFFRDGRSPTVWYYDDKSYGWCTNPWFQELVESGNDTLGVPGVYREAVERSLLFAAAEAPEAGFCTVENGRIKNAAQGGTPEWALVQALMGVALLLETHVEQLILREEAGEIDFHTEYVTLANLERVLNSYAVEELHETKTGYIATVTVDPGE